MIGEVVIGGVGGDLVTRVVVRDGEASRRGCSRARKTKEMNWKKLRRAARFVAVLGDDEHRGFGLVLLASCGKAGKFWKHCARGRDEALDDVLRGGDLLARAANLQQAVGIDGAVSRTARARGAGIELDSRATDLTSERDIASTATEDATDVLR